MKRKISALLLCIVFLLSGCGCAKGVILDESETIVGNGTWQVTKGDSVYTIMNNNIMKDDVVLYQIDNIKTYTLFALGEYLYVNTTEGAMQLKLDGSKISKFGAGEILAAKGRWIYYQSDKSQVRGMSMYKIDMKEGREVLLYEATTVSAEQIEPDLFMFTTPEGVRYVNELNSDEAFYYEEWYGVDATEIEEVTE